MKKGIILFILIVINYGFSRAETQNFIFKVPVLDTVRNIHKIKMNLNYGEFLYSFRPLDGHRFTVIFEENGNATLKRQAKCNTNVNDTLPCKYVGKIPKREYTEISKFLNKIKFSQLLDQYNGDSEGNVIFEIFYDNGNVKIIRVEGYGIKELNELRERLIKIKKSIKWVAM